MFSLTMEWNRFWRSILILFTICVFTRYFLKVHIIHTKKNKLLWQTFLFKHDSYYVQLNKYETVPHFNHISQKFDIRLFVDLAEFPCFYEVLAWPDHKIVLQIKAKQFFDQVMQELRKNREIQLNQQTIWCQVLAE